MSQYILYNLLCFVLSIFDEESLGDTEALYILAEKLLKWEFIGEDFWNKVSYRLLFFIHCNFACSFFVWSVSTAWFECCLWFVSISW